jgi:outer membrane biogenesis lipoprotein LolB
MRAKLAVGVIEAAFVTMLALGLTGCATNTSPTQLPSESLESTAAKTAANIKAAYAERFQISARMSIRVGEKLDTVKVEWTRTPPDEVMKIFTPFGAQIAELSANRDGATMRYQGDKNTPQVATAATVGDLTASAMGVRLETQMLANWVQGLNLNNATNFAVFPDQANAPWKVEAEGFRLIDGVKVASRITAISGDTVVKVVIDTFRVVQ